MEDKKSQFTQFILSLMNSHGDARSQIEKAYFDAIRAQPEEFYQGLLYMGIEHPTKDVRQFSLVLLRSDIAKHTEKWLSFSDNTRGFIQSSLMSSVAGEADEHIRATLRELLITLAQSLLERKQEWPLLLSWLLEMAQSNEAGNKESSLLILANILNYYGPFFKEQDNFFAMLHIIKGSLTGRTPKVGIASFQCLITFSQLFSREKQHLQHVQQLVSSVMEMIMECFGYPHENFVHCNLKLLIDFAELDAGYFIPFAKEVFNQIFAITERPNLTRDSMKLCIEFLVVFIENKPTFANNIEGFIEKFVDILLMIMSEMKDVELSVWANQFDVDENDIENADVAQVGLDRISTALEGNKIFIKLFSDDRIPVWIQSDNWKLRALSLTALTQISEGCKALLVSALDQLLPLVTSLRADPHPRVRYAFAMVLGQFSTDLAPTIQKKCHHTVVPCLVELLKDEGYPKVQAAALSSIVSFTSYLGRKEISVHLDSLIASIVDVLQKSMDITVMVEHCLTAISGVAASAGTYITKYYSSLIPSLKALVTLATTEEHKLIRARGIECFTIIGTQSGKEVFMQDVFDLMGILGSLEQYALNLDDPMHNYIMRAWMQISVCLGDDFAPYLKYVIPLLLKAASKPVVMANDPSLEDEEGWDVVQIGDNKTAIHTSALEEKSNACNMLYLYASTLKESFLPYIVDVSNLIVPHLTFDFHEGIRNSAFAIVPHLLRISLEQFKSVPTEENKAFVGNLYYFFMPKLIEAVGLQFDDESKALAFETLGAAISIMGPDSLQEGQVMEIINLSLTEINILRTKTKGLMNRQSDDADDNMNVKEEMRNLASLAEEIGECLGGLLSTHTSLYIHHGGQIIEMAKLLVLEPQSDAQMHLGICLFVDIIANAKEQSLFLFAFVLPVFLNGLNTQDFKIRQASCYGIGVAVENGKDNFQINDITEVTKLLVGIAKADLGVQAAEETKEAALIAIGKIIKQYITIFPAEFKNPLITVWIQGLPLEFDVIEAPKTHELLCQLISTYGADVMGPDWCNFPLILNVFGQILQSPKKTELITQETLALLKHLLHALPLELLLKGISVLEESLQKELKIFLGMD